MKKIVSVLLTVVMLAAMMSPVFASFPITIGSATAPTGMHNAAKMILGVIQYVGYAFAVGMLLYIGIKYAMSAANEKADLKKGLINFVIGALLIACASAVCGWIATIGSSIS